jgi:hypothetical protein
MIRAGACALADLARQCERLEISDEHIAPRSGFFADHSLCEAEAKQQGLPIQGLLRGGSRGSESWHDRRVPAAGIVGEYIADALLMLTKTPTVLPNKPNRAARDSWHVILKGGDCGDFAIMFASCASLEKQKKETWLLGTTSRGR